ncbi:MAG: chemotaxis response regulator protein-glutamate methylesterase [Isosphaerales bacterium]
MPKIRILVVDDSVVFRRLVSEELSRDPELEVVGTAANGRIALAKLGQLSPDLVILDITMPEMDGLETLKELRKTYQRLPVIMFSSLTERGAAETLEALALGASDYFTKPADVGGLDNSLRVIREEMVPMIKALCAPLRQQTARAGAGTSGLTTGKPPIVTGTIRVLAIGASTGGPNALSEIFTRLPADFPVPIVIVQHMPPMFTRLMAERLSAQSPIHVQEASSGCLLKPGDAWVAPGDYHMIVVRDGLQYRLLVHQDPPENSCRPAVDVLLRSVAQSFGADSLTVILTGMGQDGLRGCESLRAAGGQVLVQDEATSVVWGMPGYVAGAGLADRVLPLAMIAGEIVQRVRAQKRPLRDSV